MILFDKDILASSLLLNKIKALPEKVPLALKDIFSAEIYLQRHFLSRALRTGLSS